MDTTLEKIYRSGLKFLEPLSLEETYKTIVGEALKLVKSEAGTILIMQPNGEFKRVYCSDPKWAKIKTRRRGTNYQVYKTGIPRVMSTEEIARVHPEAKEVDIRSSILIPLSYRNKTIGVMTVQSTKDNHFGEKELSILKMYAPLASLAITKTGMYEETKEALSARDSFISMASHELRTPLTTINGYVQLLYGKLLNGENTNPKSSECKWVEELSWETFRLTQLVKELLEVNRINSGNVEYIWGEYSLKEIVKRGIGSIEREFPKHLVKFETRLKNSDDLIICDQEKLTQAIYHVLENAAKFSLPGDQIIARLSEKASNLVLTVIDQGHGIERDELARVFEGYYIGSNHQREGLGVGLFLTKFITDNHRGTIRIQSKVNKGTKVEISLPKKNRGKKYES